MQKLVSYIEEGDSLLKEIEKSLEDQSDDDVGEPLDETDTEMQAKVN